MNDKVKIKLNDIDNAKEFSSICEKYDEDIDYVIGRYVIDAKSILGILSTILGKIADVKIHTKDIDVKDRFNNSIIKWGVKEDI